VIRVLVVEDDFMVGRIHAGYVARTPGFMVVGTVQTGKAALARVAEDNPDLILLDIYLPDMSGVDLLRQLRASGSPVDVLIITASRDVETVRAAVQGGALHYLIKPFTFAALHERLERYAEAHRRIVSVGQAGQQDVDRMFDLLRGGGTATALPKGLSAATCDLVVSVLREAGGDLSASEAAERAGLSRVSTRRYLDWLVATGQADLQMRYGAAGRPQHRYRWLGKPPA